MTSHTGGMLKQDTAIELIFEKAGIVSFRNIEDLCQSAIGFASQPVPGGNRVGMIANTGGPAIIATDELIEGGMVMPPLSERTEAFLREKLYPEASINNPVDVLATAGPEHFAAAISALLEDDGIDAVFLNFVTPFFVDTKGVAREIAKANKRSRKPIVATVMTEKKGWAETLKIIRDGGVPAYDMPETGAKVLVSMGRYAALSKRPVEKPMSFADVDTSRARSLVKKVVDARGTWMATGDGFRLLESYGIPVARYESAATVDDCVAAAERIGYPVVVKVDAESVVHKTDSGAVALGLSDADAVREQVVEWSKRFADASPRFLVQEQLEGGCEVIVGAKAEPGLGHIVMFGLGGIYVEVLKDVSFKLAPVTECEAGDMIKSLRASRLLTGVRGRAGVDVDALAETIQRVSQMVVENREIRELDINPIFAFEEGIKAADVRVMF